MTRKEFTALSKPILDKHLRKSRVKVIVCYKPSLKWLGLSDHENRVIQINLGNCKTLKDALFVLLHEIRHFQQYRRNPKVFDTYISHEEHKNLYYSQFVELDADVWALSQLKKLKYKNVPISPNANSTYDKTYKRLEYNGYV